MRSFGHLKGINYKFEVKFEIYAKKWFGKHPDVVGEHCCWTIQIFQSQALIAETKQTKFSANVPTLKYLPGLTTAYIGQIGKFFMGYFSVDFKYCL